jgi:hypothetical protein
MTSNRITVTCSGAAHDVAVKMSRQEYPDEKNVCDYPQPCGHRLSGDLSGFGALASKGRCVTGINRADSASENLVHSVRGSWNQLDSAFN